MDDKKKKKFIKPEGEVVEFQNNDIITASLTDGGTLNWGGEGGENWTA